jgi:YegS/Rv2252/BmrU family lipid kinase
MSRKAAAIVNPYAAGGRTGRLWPRIARRLRERLGDVTLRPTDFAGHATEIARELIESGFDLIIAVGGDGTISEVANGFLRDDEPVRLQAQLGLLPLGTGSDFQRTLGIPRDTEEAIATLADARPLTIDVGKVKFVTREGERAQRYFVNLVSFGMGGEVAADAKNLLTPLGGKSAFLWATLKNLASYRGRQVSLDLDSSGKPLAYFITNVAAGNGRFHGGGMQACPHAIVNDGFLEITIIDYLSPFEVMRDIRLLYSGDVHHHPKVHQMRARSLVATAGQPTSIEVDGEPLGRLPIEIEILPRRLPVLLPPSSPLFAAGQD